MRLPPLTHHNFTARSRLRVQGITLIELMIALVVVGILAAIAYPSFQDSVRKSRRADAFTAITTVQQAQERWRGSHSEYAATLANTATPPAAANGLGVAESSSAGYYVLSIPDRSSTGYTVVATAVTGTSQAQDGTCKVLGVRIAGGNVTYGSGADSIDWSATNPDAGRCWAR